LNANELLLIDFSSVARPMWEACDTSEQRSGLAVQIVARVHDLALAHPHAAICMDSGRTFRHDLDPNYKGHRPEQEAAMLHQFNFAAEGLRADGFPVWAVKGFEADDLVAPSSQGRGRHRRKNGLGPARAAWQHRRHLRGARRDTGCVQEWHPQQPDRVPRQMAGRAVAHRPAVGCRDSLSRDCHRARGKADG
jgi:hypothetical protein